MNLNASGEQEKTVVLINSAIYLPGEGGYKRTMYLFDMIRKMGHKPILLTSDFNHYKKKTRNISEFRKHYPEYNDIEFFHIRAYEKNISLKRYFAENDWKNEVRKWIKKHAKEIDVVMLSMPDMNTIMSISDICKANNICMVIDIRDLRPEAFKVVLKNEYIYTIATYFMKKKADKAYASADKLFAVSEEYLKRGMVEGNHAVVNKIIYIGADIKKFDDGINKYIEYIDKPDNELWLTYAGTLGTSYDITTVIDSVRALRDERFHDKQIVFMILGQGPDRNEFEEYALRVEATNVRFVGFVEYEKMAAYLKKSDITINAIKRRGSQSIINKVADYFAAGVAMLNGCISKEQCKMVEEYNVGINYEPENQESLLCAIRKLADNDDLRIKMGENARKLALEKFDRDKTYKEIVDELYL